MKKIFYTIAVACILAACTEDLDEWTTSPSGIQTGADYVLSGKEGYRSLGLDARDVVGGETEGGFLTFVERDGKAWLYVEQNDDGAPRSGCVRLRLADGETRRLTVSQATRDVDLQENIDQGFIRNYGVGYSFEGYNGEKCSFNSVMSQVVNFETLRKVEAQESVELLSTDYRHQGYYETASGYSLSEYVHNVDFDVKGEANLILYKGSVMKNLSVLEVVDKKAFYVSSSYISPKGVRTLNTEDLKAYVAQYPNLLTQSFRKAVEDLSRHPSDIMALDSFLVRFGTHVVSSSTLGGKLDLYVSVSQESFDTYEQEQTFAKNAVPLLFKKMSSSGSDYNFKDVFNAAESRMEAYGGRISILNEAVVNPDFNNSRLQPKLLADWEASIEYDEDSYAGNNVEMVDMEMIPIWELIPDAEVARYVEARAVGTASSLCEVFGFNHFANASFPVSFDEVSCRMGGREVRFPSPYVVNVIASGRYVATVCREWVPEIAPDGLVTVAYPIYDRTMDWTAGLCVHEGKAYRVGWHHGSFVVTPLSDAPSDKFYLTSGRLELHEAEGADYQAAYPVVGYEWPGSITIGGGLSGTYYPTRKFLGHFYINNASRFDNLPNWHWQSALPEEWAAYQGKMTGNAIWGISDYMGVGRSGAENLKNRMVMDDNYEFFWNTSEVLY